MNIIKKYLPGSRPEDTIKICRYFNGHGVKCSISFLPVEKHTLEKIHKDTEVYYRLLEVIEKNKLDADITIKLNQFGIYGSRQLAKYTASQITSYAKNLNNFVWIDMETKETVDNTIHIFKEIHAQYPSTGLCFQAYLKRTENDIKDILKDKVPLRLVKGFYNDCEFETWGEVTQNYSKMMEYVLLNSDRPAIATHDFGLIEKAKQIITEYKLKTAELQFFNGVRNKLAIKLAREGFNVRVYIPFGHLIPYFIDVFPTLDKYRYTQRAFGFNKIT